MAGGPPAGPPPGGPPAGPPGGEFAEAAYDYAKQQPTDLGLRKGDHIVVLEKLNADWWRGRNTSTSEEGIFPSNYVHLTHGGPSPPSASYNEKNAYTPPPNPQYYNSGPSGQAPYNAPPPSQSAPPYFPPPSTNYYPQQQQQPQPVVVQQPPPAQGSHHGSDAFKKFGSKLGNAAIFGAGATIGSDIVNSIF
ncbi:Pin3p [Sugiyamaella lignohabitans]|uniref:Pin3p n=1 Tax=Sugiyamaella lignohabitans TaxID=796027 RepID=A0A167F7I5_9ASCO|nr:Pin3p [Sugiyamaella lignohabitans]ANB14911.1 Pin3p [Sugiyamaella lignohabitans]